MRGCRSRTQSIFHRGGGAIHRSCDRRSARRRGRYCRRLQCLLVSYMTLGLALGAPPVLQLHCNAKDHNAQPTPKSVCTSQPKPAGRQTAMRAVLLLCSAALCGAFVAQPSRPRLTKACNADPRNRGNAGSRVSAKYIEYIKLPSTPTPSVRAGRRRPVLRGRPRQRHRLQEGRVGPRDAGRTTRAEGEI